MRLLKILTLTIIVISCNDLNKERTTSRLKLKVETYLDTIPNAYVGHEDNTVIEDEMNEFLRSDFPKQFNDGLLDDLPFILEKVEKCNNKYVVNLVHALNTKYYKHGILNYFDVEIYGETDEETAKSLIERDTYLIKGTFKEYLTFRNNKKYCAFVLVSPFMGYGSGLTDNEIEFGAIGIKLDSIKRFENQ